MLIYKLIQTSGFILVLSPINYNIRNAKTRLIICVSVAVTQRITFSLAISCEFLESSFYDSERSRIIV